MLFKFHFTIDFNFLQNYSFTMVTQPVIIIWLFLNSYVDQSFIRLIEVKKNSSLKLLLQKLSKV